MDEDLRSPHVPDSPSGINPDTLPYDNCWSNDDLD